jgi:hypothetical protein
VSPDSRATGGGASLIVDCIWYRLDAAEKERKAADLKRRQVEARLKVEEQNQKCAELRKQKLQQADREHREKQEKARYERERARLEEKEWKEGLLRKESEERAKEQSMREEERRRHKEVRPMPIHPELSFELTPPVVSQVEEQLRAKEKLQRQARLSRNRQHSTDLQVRMRARRT